MAVAALCLVAGCTGSAVAPVSSRGEQQAATTSAKPDQERVTATPTVEHSVIAGDTLYGIAWRYGLDYRDVALWNRISSPYLIRPGQRLRLTAPAVAAAPPQRSAPAPVAREPEPPARQPDVVKQTGPIKWQWPTRGTPVKLDTPSARKGIDIAGQTGQVIAAAAVGEVVYSGSGLLGYGRLIIIKHSDTFLSAYAYNERLLVSEGDTVGMGQQIATMGKAANGQTALHFEIRKDGKPVNPLDYLPRRSS